MREAIYATIWANYYGWPIKNNHFLLVALLEIFGSCAYFTSSKSVLHYLKTWAP
jgi:hypothetical protein